MPAAAFSRDGGGGGGGAGISRKTPVPRRFIHRSVSEDKYRPLSCRIHVKAIENLETKLPASILRENVLSGPSVRIGTIRPYKISLGLKISFFIYSLRLHHTRLSVTEFKHKCPEMLHVVLYCPNKNIFNLSAVSATESQLPLNPGRQRKTDFYRPVFEAVA